MSSTRSPANEWPPSKGALELASPTSIRARGWCQGSVLSARLTALIHEGADDFVAIVVSHDCDVVNSRFEVEAQIEVQLATVVEVANGNFLRGKNPRTIQLKVDGGSVLEAEAGKRHLIDRRLLALDDPAWALGGREVQELTRWLAARYIRSAFPDAFNERIRPALKQVAKLAQKEGQHISGIYFLISTDELEDELDYDIQVRATIEVEDYEQLAIRTKCNKALDGIVAAINGCEGINVYDHEAVSEEDFSLDDLRLMKRWDWDHVSLKPDPVHAIAPSR